MTRLELTPGERFPGTRVCYIEDAGVRGAGRKTERLVKCVCDCGTIWVTLLRPIRNGRTLSCGCFGRKDRSVRTTERNTTHGQAARGQQTPLYQAWGHMKARCLPGGEWQAKRPTYVGVQCDPHWETFEGFRDNPPTGTNPYGPTREFAPGLVLARVGDKGNYTPGNTRWLTPSENSRENKENVKGERSMHVLADGRFAIDVARENGVKPGAFWNRLSNLGWSVEDAVLPAKPEWRTLLLADGSNAADTAETNGIAGKTFKRRLGRGWDLERAVLP